jgi:hypothetical protein
VSNRRVMTAAMSTLAIGLWSLAAAAVGRSSARLKLSETKRLINVGSRGQPGTAAFRRIKAGTVDGKIGATRVHGAERSLVQIIDSSREIVHGTEFDGRGSRSFVLHIHYTITRAGQRSVKGTGRWTGGTGAYKRARGSFTVSGAGPLGALLPVRETGWISYA